MFLQFNNKFLAVNDAPPTGGGAKDLDSENLNADKLYDLLGEDDDESPIDLEDKGEKKAPKAPKEKVQKEDEDDEPKPEGEDDGEEELDELAELEAELEGPSEEQLELMTPVRRKEILKEFPDLFKKFPYLEKAYYREQQFTEIYPTIDDARAAAEKSQALDRFESELMKGSSDNILKAIKEEDPNAFHKIVDNYMIALWNVDQMAYHHVVGNINKTLVASMITEGRKLNNDALQQAAAIVQQYVFGNSEWQPPTRLAKDANNPDRQNLDTERQQFLQQRFETARDELTTRVNNSLASTIEQNIDPKSAMTSYVKNAACADAMRTLQKLLNNDSRFQSIKNRLWENAAQNNYNKASVDRIKSAIAAKAKSLLPTVIKKARIEALKGLGKRVKDDTEDVNDGTTRPNKDRKTTSSSNSGRGDNYREKAKAIPRGTSTLDYLNQD